MILTTSVLRTCYFTYFAASVANQKKKEKKKKSVLELLQVRDRKSNPTISLLQII